MQVRNNKSENPQPVKAAPVHKAWELPACELTNRLVTSALQQPLPKPTKPIGRAEDWPVAAQSVLDTVKNETDLTSHELTEMLGDVRDPEKHRLAKDLLSEAPEISQYFGKRVTKLQVITILYLMMQMEADSIYENRRSRQAERALQLDHMENEKKTYMDMSDMLRATGIGSAILGIFSGVISIGGQFGGDMIKNALGMVLSSFKEMKTDKAMEQISKMLSGMSEFGRMTGQAQQAYYTGHTSEAAHRAGLHGSYVQNTTEEMRTRDQAHQSCAEVARRHFDRLEQFEQALAR
jgi:hypothetical protein